MQLRERFAKLHSCIYAIRAEIKKIPWILFPEFLWILKYADFWGGIRLGMVSNPGLAMGHYKGATLFICLDLYELHKFTHSISLKFVSHTRVFTLKHSLTNNFVVQCRPFLYTFPAFQSARPLGRVDS